MHAAKTYGTGEKVILSVEDDPACYEILEMAFRQVGGNLRLYRVENGEEALNFLRGSPEYSDAPKPHLILLNINLPMISGFEVLQAIKDNPALASIPAVVFSSSDLDRDKAKCLALGARDFVTKPSDFDEFVKRLRYACSLTLG